MAGSSPSLPDGSNPSAAIVQSASDVQCSRLLKTTDKIAGADFSGKNLSQKSRAKVELTRQIFATRRGPESGPLLSFSEDDCTEYQESAALVDCSAVYRAVL
ncbi:hypothetical protein, partial [Roseomonas mucosa]|uniref:hypothetical protein n=1 Tax=Roseomonas mucosa TaxID=207340 RepID=UPI0028CC9EA8